MALDVGDVWTGIALSDPLGITARPYETIRTDELPSFLTRRTTEQQIGTVVVGHPQTLRGTASEQTKKVEAYAQELEKQFPTLSWVLWDERFTSKQASQLKRAKTKEAKREQHAIAAAFILRTYLDHVSWKQP